MDWESVKREKVEEKRKIIKPKNCEKKRRRNTEILKTVGETVKRRKREYRKGGNNLKEKNSTKTHREEREGNVIEERKGEENGRGSPHDTYGRGHTTRSHPPLTGFWCHSGSQDTSGQIRSSRSYTECPSLSSTLRCLFVY